MRKQIVIGLAVALLSVGSSSGQTDTAKQSQSAKEDVKDAGKATGRAAKKTGKAIGKGTKKVVNKAAGATEKGAAKVKDKTTP